MATSTSANRQTTYMIIGLAAAAGIALWLSLSKAKRSKDIDGSSASSSKGSGDNRTPTKSNVRSTASSSSSSSSRSTAASTASPSKEDEEKALHRRIEEIDREGKALFKDKKYMEAAEMFTKALDLIETTRSDSGKTTNGNGASSSLVRQIVTLTNNRSAMYEKGQCASNSWKESDLTPDVMTPRLVSLNFPSPQRPSPI